MNEVFFHYAIVRSEGGQPYTVIGLKLDLTATAKKIDSA